MAVKSFEEIGTIETAKRPVKSFDDIGQGTAQPTFTPELEWLINGVKPVEHFLQPDDRDAFEKIIGEDIDKNKLAGTLALGLMHNQPPEQILNFSDEIAQELYGGAERAWQFYLKEQLAAYQQKKQDYYIRSKFRPVSLFGKAFQQSMTEKPAMAIKGAKAYTPGKALGFDTLLTLTSDYLRSLQDKEIKKELEVVSTGKLWPVYEGQSWFRVKPELVPETINTWAATTGDQIPIMIMTALGRLGGKYLGGIIGKGAGYLTALATAGPGASDIVTAPLVAKIVQKTTEHLGGAAPLVAMEAGGFLDRADSIGLDDDIAEKYARSYGLGSGTIEYLQWIWNLKAFDRFSGLLQKTITRRVLTEIGGAVWEGAEEISQQGLENHLIRKAIIEQKQRNPDYDEELPETWAGGGRAFATAFGVSLITRAPGHAYTTIRRQKIADGIAKNTGATPQEAQVISEIISSGGAMADTAADTIKQQIVEQQKTEDEAESASPAAVPEIKKASTGISSTTGGRVVRPGELSQAGENLPVSEAPEGTEPKIPKEAKVSVTNLTDFEAIKKEQIRQAKNLKNNYEEQEDNAALDSLDKWKNRIIRIFNKKAQEKGLKLSVNYDLDSTYIDIDAPEIEGETQTLQIRLSNHLQKNAGADWSIEIIDDNWEKILNYALEDIDKMPTGEIKPPTLEEIMNASPEKIRGMTRNAGVEPSLISMDENRKKLIEYYGISEVPAAKQAPATQEGKGTETKYVVVRRKLPEGKMRWEAYGLDGKLLAVAPRITGKGSISDKFYNRKGTYIQSVSYDLMADTDTKVTPEWIQEQSPVPTTQPEATPALSPEQYQQGEITPPLLEPQRKRLIKETTEQIQKHPIYELEMEGIETTKGQIGTGYYYVPKKFKGEVEQITGEPFKKGFNATLYKMFTFDPSKGATDWEKAVQSGLSFELQGELGGEYDVSGAMDISEFVSRVKQALEAQKQKGGLNKDVLDKMLKSGDLQAELLISKLEWLQQGLSADEINDNIKRWAAGYEISEENIAGEFVISTRAELVAGEKPRTLLAPSEEAEITQQTKKLRSQIHILAATKGMSDKAKRDLFMKVGGARNLTGKRKDIPLQKLEDIYEAMKKVRPTRVERQKIITRKTENQIQTYKKNLKAMGLMNDATWKDILKRTTGGKEPVYKNYKSYITQKEAGEVLRVMHNEEVKQKIIAPIEKARNSDTEEGKIIRKIESDISSKKKWVYHSTQSSRFYYQNIDNYLQSKGIKSNLFELFEAIMEQWNENRFAASIDMDTVANSIGEQNFKTMLKDEVSLKRISDYIAAKSSLKEKPQSPADIKPDELKVAQTIEQIYRKHEVSARLGKFLKWYEQGMPLDTSETIADYEMNKQNILKAVKIYDTQGLDALKEYLVTQTWGVVESGYDPREMLKKIVQTFKGLNKSVAEGRIRVRDGIYYLDQEKNIIQRLSGYVRQIRNITELKPLINAFIEELENKAENIEGWQQVRWDTELFLDELKGFAGPRNWFERLLHRFTGATATTLIENNPTIAVWNVFEPYIQGTISKKEFAKQLTLFIQNKNRSMTPEDLRDLNVHHQQLKNVLDYINQNYEEVLPLPGLKQITTWAHYISLLSRSDSLSRNISYKSKLDQIYRAVESSESLQEVLGKIDWETFHLNNQKKAIAIYHNKGMDAFARYLAGTYTDDTHFKYVSPERAPAEMGSVGRIFSSLINWPRSWTERIIFLSNTILNENADTETRYKAAVKIVGIVFWSYIGGNIAMILTGRKRNPWGIPNILDIKFGGLYTSALTAITGLWSCLMNLGSFDEKEREKSLTELPKLIANLPSIFYPFYGNLVRFMEKLADIKYIDVYALRGIREIFDSDYKRRASNYEFNKEGFISDVQYVLFGRSTDYKTEERRTKSLKGISID